MNALLSQNGRAFVTTLGGAVAYVGLCGVVGKLGLLPSRLARKMMHIGTGPLFMLCWPLYSAASSSRWLAACVPALAGLQFVLVGKGIVQDDTLVAGASRSGRRDELLRGPLLYAAVHVAATLLWWRNSPCGVLALSTLCAGDGLAEVVGRACSSEAAAANAPTARGRKSSSTGKKSSSTGSSRSWRRSVVRALARPLSHNREKTVGGSLACWLGGAAASFLLLRHFKGQGMFEVAGARHVLLDGWALACGALLCSAAGALAESLPIGGEADNVTIAVAVAVCSRA